MCGIAGIVTFGHGSQERWHNELLKMNQAIAHRGKSGHGHYSDKTHSCFLTHRRLSIIDLSDSAAQPMTSADGRYVMVFNGEIYNYQEIAATLGPSYEALKSDTAVLLAAYAMQGPSVVHTIRGMFAFAIWDTVEQSLFVARDHVGIKPLYFSHELVDGKKVFTFASELKAFFSTSYIPRRINKRALVDYLTYYCVNAPLTLLEKVYALEPGHYMTLDKQGLKSTRYWHPQDIEIDSSLTNAAQIKKTVADTLDQSVALAMCADIEVGAFLSGGIDSTTIVGLMKRHTQKQIKTFSIGFGKEGADLDERDLARTVARHFDTDHHELVVDAYYFKREFSRFIMAIDQPSGDGINNYLVSKLASEDISVSLSGLGGDELFLGYSYFKELTAHHYFLKNPIHKMLYPLYQQLYQRHSLVRSAAYKMGFNFLRFSSAQSYAQWYHAVRRLFTPEQVRDLLVESLPASYTAMNAVDSIFETESDLLNAFSKAELAWYVPGMLLRDGDATAMASTLEVRFPFLDQELMTLLLKIPSRFKVNRNQKYNKPLLVSLFDQLLPKSIVTGRKKGFEMPVGHWIQIYFVKELLQLKQTSWLNPQAVEQLLQQLYRNPRNYLPVWSLLVLKAWIDFYDIEGFDEPQKSSLYTSWQGAGRRTVESVVLD